MSVPVNVIGSAVFWVVVTDWALAVGASLTAFTVSTKMSLVDVGAVIHADRDRRRAIRIRRRCDSYGAIGTAAAKNDAPIWNQRRVT